MIAILTLFAALMSAEAELSSPLLVSYGSSHYEVSLKPGSLPTSSTLKENFGPYVPLKQSLADSSHTEGELKETPDSLSTKTGTTDNKETRRRIALKLGKGALVGNISGLMLILPSVGTDGGGDAGGDGISGISAIGSNAIADEYSNSNG
ncbi:MAG: hypothetical protein J4F35_04220 [Candidatus Latescibacteria bacterium]|nr:hypothetical protein [Candidatus Latescibacterota bacterium]